MSAALSALKDHLPVETLRTLLAKEPALLLISAPRIAARIAAMQAELSAAGTEQVIRSKPQLLLMSEARVAAQREGLARVVRGDTEFCRGVLRACPSLVGYSLDTLEAKGQLLKDYVAGSKQWGQELEGWSPAAWGNVLRASAERYH